VPALAVIEPVVKALPATVNVAELEIPLTVSVPALAVIDPRTADCKYSVDAVTAAEL
jgi:hypothetical protein